MLGQINELWIQFNAFTKSNPVVAGVVSLWGLSVATFLLRGVPSRIIGFVKRQSTTTLTINSQDRVYYDFLKWVSGNSLHSFVRTLNFNNHHRGWGRGAYLSIGYGTTFFFFRGNFFIMRRYEVQANQTEYTKEQVTVTVIGRQHKVFKELFDEILKQDEKDREYTKVWTFNGEQWQLLCKQYKRPLDTVVINKDTKAALLKHIDSFNDNKDWYKRNGIPYRTGVLLQGPPGTGKTSLIKGVCAYYDKDLYLINLEHISDKGLHKALAGVPEGSVVAIEDIDACGVNLNRKDPFEKLEEMAEATEDTGEVTESIGEQQESKKAAFGFLTISGILNAIDGVASAEDRILIATTNHPELLDPALLREGRFDIRLNVGHMTKETFTEYMSRFYTDFKMPENVQLKQDIAPCKVQKMIFDNMNDPGPVLKSLTIPADKEYHSIQA